MVMSYTYLLACSPSSDWVRLGPRTRSAKRKKIGKPFLSEWV